MHLLLKYASRSRPSRFFEGLHNIVDLAADKMHYTVFCCLDKDDATIDGAFMDTFNEHAEKFRNVIIDLGQSFNKIHAINRPVPTSIPWDVLVNFSDDMRFVCYGYDELIRDGVRINGPDIYLHYPDSTAKNMLTTMHIVDRPYFERFGYIYHPSYQSLWCDNENDAVAKALGRYRYMGIQIYDHLHPAYGLAQWDAQYERQQALWGEDELNFKIRQSINFELDKEREV